MPSFRQPPVPRTLRGLSIEWQSPKWKQRATEQRAIATVLGGIPPRLLAVSLATCLK